MKNSGQKFFKTLLMVATVGVIFFTLFLSVAPVSAQTLDYTPLAPLPGIGGDGAKVNDLASYVEAMFRLLIGIAAALAVIMIMVGGIQYMSTATISGKGEGLGKINHALMGLLLAIGAWLILSTVNPATLEFKFNPAVPPPPPPEKSGIFILARRCKVVDEIVNKGRDGELQITYKKNVDSWGMFETMSKCYGAKPTIERQNRELDRECVSDFERDIFRNVQEYKDLYACMDLSAFAQAQAQAREEQNNAKFLRSLR